MMRLKFLVIFILFVRFSQQKLFADPNETVCNQPVDSGPCEFYRPMWFYDVTVGKCRSFEYGGCEGNENKFMTENHCKATCLSSENLEMPMMMTQRAEADTPAICLLKADSGGCGIVKNRFIRGRWYYYYDTWKKKCLLFWFWGCGGNSNRFKTRPQCKRTCTELRFSELKSSKQSDFGLVDLDAEEGRKVRSLTLGCPKCEPKTGYCDEQTNGTFVCLCKKGFIKNSKDECIDENECLTGRHTCSPFAWCENRVGTFQCSCMIGYEGNGQKCKLIPQDNFVYDCSKCHSKADCVDGKCKCRRGFKGDGYYCEDVNECSAPDTPCSINAECYNTAGSYYCLCKTGYAGNGFSCTSSDAVCDELFDDQHRQSCGQGQWQPRYFYDRSTRECTRFWYDSCKGSSRNIFTDIQTCQTICEKPAFRMVTMAPACDESFDRKYLDECGRGDWEERYFFNQTTGQCDKFWYDQCTSESRNIFFELSTCQLMCETPTPVTVTVNNDPDGNFGMKVTAKVESTYDNPTARVTAMPKVTAKWEQDSKEFDFKVTAKMTPQTETSQKPQYLQSTKNDFGLKVTAKFSSSPTQPSKLQSTEHEKKIDPTDFKMKITARFTSTNEAENKLEEKSEKKTTQSDQSYNTIDDQSGWTLDDGKWTFESTYEMDTTTESLSTAKIRSRRTTELPEKKTSLSACDELFDFQYTDQCREGNWEERWYYNKTTGFCENFWYDGCRGTGRNIFLDFGGCLSMCENPRKSVIKLDVDERAGHRQSKSPACLDVVERNYFEQCGMGDWQDRYYYNKPTDTCEKFWYDGCSGSSRNIFVTLENCESNCDAHGFVVELGPLGMGSDHWLNPVTPEPETSTSLPEKETTVSTVDNTPSSTKQRFFTEVVTPEQMSSKPFVTESSAKFDTVSASPKPTSDSPSSVAYEKEIETSTEYSATKFSTKRHASTNVVTDISRQTESTASTKEFKIEVNVIDLPAPSTSVAQSSTTRFMNMVTKEAPITAPMEQADSKTKVFELPTFPPKFKPTTTQEQETTFSTIKTPSTVMTKTSESTTKNDSKPTTRADGILRWMPSCKDDFDPFFFEQCRDGNWQERYLYNKTSKLCEKFWYDYCLGKGRNIFPDRYTCEEMCNPVEKIDERWSKKTTEMPFVEHLPTFEWDYLLLTKPPPSKLPSNFTAMNQSSTQVGDEAKSTTPTPFMLLLDNDPVDSEKETSKGTLERDETSDDTNMVELSNETFKETAKRDETSDDANMVELSKETFKETAKGGETSDDANMVELSTETSKETAKRDETSDDANMVELSKDHRSSSKTARRDKVSETTNILDLAKKLEASESSHTGAVLRSMSVKTEKWSPSCKDEFDVYYFEQCGEGAWQERYFYNKTSKLCEKFWYDNCPGRSKNIFSDLESCESMCTTKKDNHSKKPAKVAEFPTKNSKSNVMKTQPMDINMFSDMPISTMKTDKPKETTLKVKQAVENPNKGKVTKSNHGLSHYCEDKFDIRYTQRCRDGKFDRRYFFNHTKKTCDSFMFDGCPGTSRNFFRDQLACRIICEPNKVGKRLGLWEWVPIDNPTTPINQFHVNDQSMEKVYAFGKQLTKEEMHEDNKLNEEGPYADSQDSHVTTEQPMKAETAEPVVNHHKKEFNKIQKEEVTRQVPNIGEHGIRMRARQVTVSTSSCKEPFDESYSKSCGGQNWQTKYYYDSATGQCHMFWYDQCKGSGKNIFPDLETCQWLCEGTHPKPEASSCLETFDDEYTRGCYGGHWNQRFYFDHTSKRCLMFWYGGCQSESKNIFRKADTCQNLCERPHRGLSRACLDPFDEQYKDSCGSLFQMRYYYDINSKECRMFWFGNCKGKSENIFPDLATCQWLCERTKSSDPPKHCIDEFDEGYRKSCGSGQWLERYYFDHRTGSCKEFFYDHCKSESQNIFPDKRTCQWLCEVPSPPYHPPTNAPDQCLEDLSPGHCKLAYPAFYYNRNEGRCLPFSYTGCGGNRNRFLTSQQCEHMCSIFSAVTGVDTDCLLPLDVGHGRDNDKCLRKAGYMFYYNRDYGKCGRFWYFGCSGNVNRYSTEAECNIVCTRRSTAVVLARPTDPGICFLPSDEGKCDYIADRPKQRWTYKFDLRKCEPFNYNGCGGNGNRFGTKQGCDAACKGLRKPKSAYCAAWPDWGPCNQLRWVWFYNMTAGVCEQFLYGGCEGNMNNFETFDECQVACEVSGKDACADPLDRGIWCERLQFRYYYNSAEQRCRGFHYTGCGSSANNFKTMAECENACIHRNVTVAASEGGSLAAGTYSGEKPAEKQKVIQKYVFTAGDSKNYLKTPATWVDYSQCLGFRYTIFGKLVVMRTHLCLMEGSGECISETLTYTEGKEKCRILRPWLRGFHLYSWFFTLEKRPRRWDEYPATGSRKNETMATLLLLGINRCWDVC